MVDLSGVPQFVAGGLAVGTVYGMVGAGFSLIYNSSRVVNFAQGEFVVVGGLAAVSLTGLLGSTWTALAGAIGVVLLIGAAMYLVLRLANRASTEFTFVMVTLAAAIALRGASGLVWGTEYRTFPLYSTGAVKVLGAVVSHGTLWMLGVTVLACLALWGILYRTRVGKAMRACASDAMAAQTVGIDPRRMVLASYLGSALLGAVAGILLTPMLMMSYDNGVALALKGFTAAVAGGLVSPFGAIAGGLLIGVLEGLGVGLLSSELQNAYAFMVLLLVLLVRPQGLFGARPAQASS
jgi:branched-chain amino acid transport system permease protein